MELRAPTAADGERIREVVESSMTTSYRLSPQQIERITAVQFGQDVLTGRADSDETVLRVAELDDEAVVADGEGGSEGAGEPLVVGYVEGVLDESWGELRWLFVDPEHRGQGIGEELFEAGKSALREAGAEHLRATTLEANAESEEFFEHYGFERIDDRRVDFGEERLIEYVYAEPSADVEPAEEASDQPRNAVESGEMELPNTEPQDGVRTATTADGEAVYLDLEDLESGTEAPFFATYTDEELTDQYGYYCSNCGSLEVAMDTVERMECEECGNDHASRSGKSYDESYL